MQDAPFRITGEFEPQDWRDRTLIPWWWLRWWFAWSWYWSWRICLILRWWKRRSDRIWDFYTIPGRGRHSDPTPYCCPRCLWSGPYRWLVHGYQDDGTGLDVEPVDECPRCGLGW